MPFLIGMIAVVATAVLGAVQIYQACTEGIALVRSRRSKKAEED